MSDPQVEDGFTRIANELVEQFATLNLSKYEWRVLWVVLRKTYGWNKKEDAISVSQIEAITGLDRRNVSRAKRGLLSKKVILEASGKLRINKKYKDWGVSSQTIADVVYIDTRPKMHGVNIFPGCIGVKKRDGNSVFCEYCTADVSWHATELHHIVPRSLGGIDKESNLARLCKPCHKKVHDEMKSSGVVGIDDMPNWYRHFVSLLSSVQTRFLSSVETPQKTLKDNYKKQDAKKTGLAKPALDEVKTYCRERGNDVDPERFWNYYEANGWRVGRNPMKNWKAAVVTWERNQETKKAEKPFDPRDYV